MLELGLLVAGRTVFTLVLCREPSYSLPAVANMAYVSYSEATFPVDIAFAHPVWPKSLSSIVSLSGCLCEVITWSTYTPV